MGTLTIELPSHAAQAELNLRRWAELLDDPKLAKIEGRIETDRHGHIIMSPPPRPNHGRLQLKIGSLIQSQMSEGETLTECPISTADGVKLADVAWASPQCMSELGDRICFPRSPEICVGVLSSGNMEEEIKEKMMLYFDAGATEVWVCSDSGAIQFFDKTLTDAEESKLCPEFPKCIELA